MNHVFCHEQSPRPQQPSALPQALKALKKCHSALAVGERPSSSTLDAVKQLAWQAITDWHYRPDWPKDRSFVCQQQVATDLKEIGTAYELPGAADALGLSTYANWRHHYLACRSDLHQCESGELRIVCICKDRACPLLEAWSYNDNVGPRAGDAVAFDMVSRPAMSAPLGRTFDRVWEILAADNERPIGAVDYARISNMAHHLLDVEFRRKRPKLEGGASSFGKLAARLMEKGSAACSRDDFEAKDWLAVIAHTVMLDPMRF